MNKDTGTCIHSWESFHAGLDENSVEHFRRCVDEIQEALFLPTVSWLAGDVMPSADVFPLLCLMYFHS